MEKEKILTKLTDAGLVAVEGQIVLMRQSRFLMLA